MRILTFLLVLICFSMANAQNAYSSSDLQQFTDLYFDVKAFKPDTEANFQDLLTTHAISLLRYREILHLSLVDDLPDLEANELAFINDLKSQRTKAMREKEEFTKALVVENNFDYPLYLELQAKFKTDLKFQSVLKPYFENSLNRN